MSISGVSSTRIILSTSYIVKHQRRQTIVTFGMYSVRNTTFTSGGSHVATKTAKSSSSAGSVRTSAITATSLQQLPDSTLSPKGATHKIYIPTDAFVQAGGTRGRFITTFLNVDRLPELVYVDVIAVNSTSAGNSDDGY